MGREMASTWQAWQANGFGEFFSLRPDDDGVSFLAAALLASSHDSLPQTFR